jgi:hypothetical protein
MRRRDLLTATAAAAGATILPGPSRAANSPLRAAARDAFIYALPMVEIANVRARTLGVGIKAGRFAPQRSLATPETRRVTTPNNDTIYASAFIDLSKGPARLTVPPSGSRYVSFALMDMVSDNIAVLGTRTTGSEGGVFTLVGPTDAGPVDAIRSPTPWVWALSRVLVDGPDDLEAARAMQAGFKVEAAEGGPAAPGCDRNGPWADYLKAANALMLENPPAATDLAILRRMAPLGLGAAGFDPSRFSPAEAAEIAAGVDEARALVRQPRLGAKVEGGWIYQGADSGEFFQDYAYRARIALSGLAALPPSEAMYLTAMNPAGGASFDGDGMWRLRFPPGQTPPVDAFWSLTMYEVTPAGQFFLTANPINRYAIGDRTQGLARSEDGSLDIRIARPDPNVARSANWLPAPAKGPFAMLLRAYLPRSEMLSHTYVPPSVERV